MPLERNTDTKGTYVKYGKRGKKFYYIPGNQISRTIADNKARKSAGLKRKKPVKPKRK